MLVMLSFIADLLLSVLNTLVIHRWFSCCNYHKFNNKTAHLDDVLLIGYNNTCLQSQTICAFYSHWWCLNSEWLVGFTSCCCKSRNSWQWKFQKVKVHGRIRVKSIICWLAGKDEADDHWSLFGVRLANDMHLNDRSFDACLGIIVLGSDWSNLLLPAIRLAICRQLHAVMNSFTFLTSEGFVICTLLSSVSPYIGN